MEFAERTCTVHINRSIINTIYILLQLYHSNLTPNPKIFEETNNWQRSNGNIIETIKSSTLLSPQRKTTSKYTRKEFNQAISAMNRFSPRRFLILSTKFTENSFKENRK